MRVRNTRTTHPPTMIPGEMLLAGAVAVGITIPVATVIEVSHPPADMDRYVMMTDCEVGGGVLPTCLVDSKTGEILGGQP